MKKYASRKFLFSIIQLCLLCGMPILFHNMGISDDVTKMVLVGVFSGHLYSFANIWDSKIKAPNEPSA